MPKIAHRDVSPLLQALRNFLLGRKHTNALRYEDTIAARTQPPPHIPDGVNHKLSANYYLTRDPRREVRPPTIIADEKLIANQKLLGATRTKLPAPGTAYRWDEHTSEH